MKHSNKKKTKAAGDKLFAKGKFKQALAKYREALLDDPENAELYDKLIETRNHLEDDWKIDDFVEILSWTMKQQELNEPKIKQVHAKLSPEWGQATDLVMKIMLANDEDQKLQDLINELVNLGATGTLALVDILRKTTRGANHE
ncbi:MAG: tetratricopeptide repeat protein [Pseudomonadota bacterium]